MSGHCARGPLAQRGISPQGANDRAGSGCLFLASASAESAALRNLFLAAYKSQAVSLVVAVRFRGAACFEPPAVSGSSVLSDLSRSPVGRIRYRAAGIGARKSCGLYAAP